MRIEQVQEDRFIYDFWLVPTGNSGLQEGDCERGGQQILFHSTQSQN